MSIVIRKFFLNHKRLAIGITVLLLIFLIIALMLLSTYIPKASATDYESQVVLSNPYISKKPMISAHRAGRFLAPENTMSAFMKCFENNNSYSVDILEFDLHITKDNELILLHDDTLDRTSDCKALYGEKKVKPEEKTLAELQKYNLGYNFKDVNGAYPYRNATAETLKYCRITTLNEALDYLLSKEVEFSKPFQYIIEIKNKDDLGRKSADILYGILRTKNMLNRAVVATFNGEITQYLDKNYPQIMRSASISEVLEFYFCCMFNVDLDTKNIKYKVMQIPYKQYVINLGKKSIVDYAHKYGIALQYWTINSARQINHLKNIGADAIITDNPQLAYDLVNK